MSAPKIRSLPTSSYAVILNIAKNLGTRLGGKFEPPPRSNVSGSFSFYFKRFHSQSSINMSKDMCNSR